MGFHPRVVYLVNLSHVLDDCRHCRSIRKAVWWSLIPNKIPGVGSVLHMTCNQRIQTTGKSVCTSTRTCIFYSIMSLRLCWIEFNKPPPIHSPNIICTHVLYTHTCAPQAFFHFIPLFLHFIQYSPLHYISNHPALVDVSSKQQHMCMLHLGVRTRSHFFLYPIHVYVKGRSSHFHGLRKG